MNLTTIDLGRAEKAVAPLITDVPQQQQQGYQPETLQSPNDARKLYLPIFPTIAYGPNDHLLLTNVPVAQLGPLEITRRQHGAYTSDALLLMKDYDFYDTRGLALSQQDIDELATRLPVGPSIITFNAERLRGHCYFFASLHESFQAHILEKTRVKVKQGLPCTSKQMALVLEFYLQMDVDVFYMKTCSFRGAEPPSNFEGLFCMTNEPEARYTLTPCGDQACSCCYPLNHGKKNQPWPVVDFISSSMHRFVNGYTTYLNCPATCNTTNVIYTMTCPCGHYDYVDSTAETLSDAMTFHRKHGNRLIHEKLIGSRLYRGMELDPEEREKEIANKMRLYQHSARCPVALRSFLDCNPNYWCFIPMRWIDALTENIIHIQRVPRQRAQAAAAASNEDPELMNILAMGAMGNDRVAHYLGHIPLTPIDYGFSYRQRQQQRVFFEEFLSSSARRPIYFPIDLYQVAIIAVLPDDCSPMLRYIIETLFITRGDTKLNMICPIGIDPEIRHGRPYTLPWCANLNHPSLPSPQQQQHSIRHTTQN